jgi:hypothetical protein
MPVTIALSRDSSEWDVTRIPPVEQRRSGSAENVGETLCSRLVNLTYVSA